MHADLEDAAGIHIDIYDAEQGNLREASDDLREQLLLRMRDRLNTDSDTAPISLQGWQVGHFPAVHC